MTQGGDDMSIEQKEATGLVDEPTNDDELCGKEIAKLKAHIGMQITIAEMDGHETFNEWFHVYPSVESYEDNLHSAWMAGVASRDAEIESLREQEPAKWTHSCNVLCLDNVELWIDRCPHCGKPADHPLLPSDVIRDAERYRFLKTSPQFAIDELDIDRIWEPVKNLDASIDTAMEGKK